MKKVIDYINEQIKAEVATHGLTELLRRQNDNDKFITFPAEYCADGEMKHIGLDNLIKETWHRHAGAVTREAGQKITACNDNIRQTYPMLLIGFIKRESQFYPDNFCQKLINLMEFSNDLNIALGANYSEVSVNSYDTDTNRIFNREYSGNEREALNLNFSMFEISYDIIIDASVNCFECQP